MTDAHPNGWTAPDRPSLVPHPHVMAPPGAYPQYIPMPVPPGWPPGAPVQRGPVLAEIWQRLLANIIDNMVMSTAGSVVAVPIAVIAVLTWDIPLGDTTSTSSGRSPEDAVGTLIVYGIVFACTLLLLFIYQTVSIAKWGATLGKKAMKLRVVSVSDGGRTGWSKAAARAGVALLFGLIPGLGLIDAAWLLWDKPNRQALHDKAAGTVVIRVDYAPVGPIARFTG